jgi:hypothetical protein
MSWGTGKECPTVDVPLDRSIERMFFCCQERILGFWLGEIFAWRPGGSALVRHAESALNGFM